MKLYDLTPRQFRFGLLTAYCLHLLILGLFIFDLIPQQYHRDGSRFWFHHGGDDLGYYAQADSILSGEFAPNKYPLGFPLLMIPVMLLIQPNGHETLVEPIAFLWSVVMFPIGQLILSWLAFRITGRRFIAWLAVVLWTVLPLLVYGVFVIGWNAEVAEVSSVHMVWAQMLSDGPATLFTLLSLAVFWEARRRDYELRWALLFGFLGGFLALIRFTGILTVGAAAVVMLVERRWREMIWMGLLALSVFSPQMVYNAHFFGGPFTTGYTVLDDLPPEGLFSLRYLGDALVQIGGRSRPVMLFALAITSAGLAWGLWLLWRFNRMGTTLLLLWMAGYAGLYSVYYYSWAGGLLRFWMPMYPALAIVLAVVIWKVYTGSKDVI